MERNCLQHNMCVLIFSTILSEIFLIPRRIQLDIIIKAWIFSTDFRKILKYQTLWKSFRWEMSSFMLTDKQIDGQTDMTKLMITFRNFSKLPKNWQGGCRKLLNKKVLDFDISPNTAGIIKSWTMIGEGHMARMWENRNIYIYMYIYM
jgi:hypothetical protein